MKPGGRSDKIQRMRENDSRAIGAFFENKWPLYQRAIRSDVLCHGEMFAALNHQLAERFGSNPFCFADFGCGDSSAVLDTLRDKPVEHYVGVDAAPDLIAAASKTMEPLGCRKTLICRDMATAIAELTFPVDVIFCSYSLHHLLLDQKAKFIQNCFHRLNTPGYFILIDGVLMEQETRDHWLQRLEGRFLEKVPDFTADDLGQIMKHPRESDHPETIATFRHLARQSPWRSFEVLVERDAFLAFMLFSK